MDERLREMGARLREEEARFLDYREIEEKTRELGFPRGGRTLRFYVTEGVLPPPARRNGRTPVYEEDWILNVLLAIHVMKTRLGRSLAEVRATIQNLREDPSALADKVSALWEEYVSVLPPARAAAVVDAFFARLSGRDGRPPAQPSEVSLIELVERIGGERPMSIARDPSPRAPQEAPPPAHESPPQLSAGPAAAPSAATPRSLPEGAVLVEKAKALEELFISRFDEAFASIRRVPHPIEQQLYPAGPRDRIHLKRTRSDEVIDLMKRQRVYERELLDVMPLDEVSEYRIFTRSIFGNKEVRVVAAACCVSPLEELIAKRCAVTRAGPRDLDRALDAVGPREGAFYYVGILSTTGWEPGVERHIPALPNLLVTLVENRGGTEWRMIYPDDERWGGMLRLFDPESEREKVERVRRALETHPDLLVRGGHVILKNFREDLGVPEGILSAAVREVLARDADLSLLEVGGKEILKRRRI